MPIRIAAALHTLSQIPQGQRTDVTTITAWVCSTARTS
jgi:hypothetical protein